MLDFTSALYLGFEHPARSLPAWRQLTLGKPAALESPPGEAQVASDLACSIGCERALLAPSTLHIFWDLFAIFARRGADILVDEHAYAIARWGVERAVGRGSHLKSFRAHDANSLRAAMRGSNTQRPIVVSDGFCPRCGQMAPLTQYLECALERNGLLVIDDTQALGIMGHSADKCPPFGRGGGGSLRRAGLIHNRIVVASSLAKGFGAPLAVLASSEALVSRFEAQSETRVFTSPPSVPVVAAAARAIQINRQHGDALRTRLAARVTRLRSGLREIDMLGTSGLFPVQSVRLPAGIDPTTVHEQLLRREIQTVLHRDDPQGAPRISFVLSARHTRGEIDHAVACLAEIGRNSHGNQEGENANGTPTE